MLVLYFYYTKLCCRAISKQEVFVVFDFYPALSLSYPLLSILQDR